MEHKRESNLELLRILMILSIIGHHFVVNSGLPQLFSFDNITFNMVFLQVFGMWGKTAINVFTLITGYFMVKSDLTLKKFLKLYLPIKFWSFLFTFIFAITGYTIFSFKDIWKIIFSMIYEADVYYAGTLIVMMLLIPFMNVLARALSKRQYQLMLAVLLIYFTFLSTFMMRDTFDFTGWLCTVYLIGGYIRLYPLKVDNLKCGVLCTTISTALMVLSIITVDFVGAKLGFTSAYHMVNDSNKLLAVTTSISIFIMFKNIRLKYNYIINTVASATFGVLLIHANSNSMRKLLWQDLFHNADHYTDSMLPLYSSMVVIVVYVVCVVLDLLRIRFVETPFFNWLDKTEIYDKVTQRLTGKDPKNGGGGYHN